MKSFLPLLIPALAVSALSGCVQPPNPAVETIRTARAFNKLARDSQAQQAAAPAPRAAKPADAAPSEEVVAFQQADARLHYVNAGIVRDDGGCAFYQGTTPDGQSARVPLTARDGRPICRR